ncbi:MAG: hypothetical protein ACI89X_000695 [Planctomycetota bacterium]|jgi:hypothetical protein
MIEAVDPKCSLCCGMLVREARVALTTWFPWSLFAPRNPAWVCVNCSAAFPIAIGRGLHFGTPPQPLYRHGERAFGEQPRLKSGRESGAGKAGDSDGSLPS